MSTKKREFGAGGEVASILGKFGFLFLVLFGFSGFNPAFAFLSIVFLVVYFAFRLVGLS